MIISLVVAATENNAIGKNNQLMWHLPNDMAFFKNTTWGMPVIMGRKTFESLKKPLKGRTNIIITRNEMDNIGDVEIANNFQKALSVAEETEAKEVFVIGGGEIFNMTIDQADIIYMTRVHTEMEGDVFFPEIDPGQWQLKQSTHFEKDNRHAYPYSFEKWERKAH